MNQELLELAQEINNELANLEKVIQRIEDGWRLFRESSNVLFLDSVALNLQSLYTKVERLFEDITRPLNETLPQGNKWHQTLLQQMAIEVSGVRPAVISPSSRDALDEYRKFRHRVRNIYHFEFDAARIQPLVEAAPNTFVLVRSDLLAFATFLESQGRNAGK